jgi:hemoglobin
MNAAASTSLYEALGGGERLRAVADRFVAEIEALPPEVPLRRLFAAADMVVYRQRLFEFLSGWLGGPPLYTQRHGLPNLRERHRHLAIGNAERDLWMLCMRRALEAEVGAAGARARLDAAFWSMANSLRSGDERPASEASPAGRHEAPPATIAARPAPQFPDGRRNSN